MNVLVVDDEQLVRRSLGRAIARAWRDARIASVGSLLEAERAMDTSRPDVVTVDLALEPDPAELSGLRLLKRLAGEGRADHAVVVTGRPDADEAAREAGARVVLHKPVGHAELREAGRVLGIPLVGDKDTIEPALLPLVGSSKAMCDLREAVRRAGREAGPVLLEGETGTGKELVARAFHGLRGREYFHAVNGSTLVDGIADSLLFGHARGAFTSAERDARGAIEQAGEGVLFLDEISDLPRVAQAKLLRVLDGYSFQPVGAERWLELRARLVSACHVDLETCVAEGTFREDLYHRVAIHHIRVPPLRARLEDVPELVQALQKRLVHPKHVTEEALAFLAAQTWPGNVRQLAAFVERASAAADDDTLGIDDVIEVARGMKGLSSRPASFPGPAKVQVARGQLDVETEALRQRLFEQALAESHHNVAAAARRLGVGRMVLMRWLQKQRAR